MALACDGVDVCHGWKLLTIILLVAGLAQSTAASAKTERKSAEVLAFKRHNPCPSTGERGGKCPGYVIDHIHPLCAGSADNHQTNMQWRTVEDAKAKDVTERRMCRNQKQQGSSKANSAPGADLPKTARLGQGFPIHRG